MLPIITKYKVIVFATIAVNLIASVFIASMHSILLAFPVFFIGACWAFTYYHRDDAIVGLWTLAVQTYDNARYAIAGMLAERLKKDADEDDIDYSNISNHR